MTDNRWEALSQTWHAHRSQIRKQHNSALYLLPSLTGNGCSFSSRFSFVLWGIEPRFELINDCLIPFSPGLSHWRERTCLCVCERRKGDYECADALTGGWSCHCLVVLMVYVWAFCLKITSSASRCILMLCFLVSILQMAYFCRTMFTLTTSNLVYGSTVALIQCVCMYYIYVCVCVHTPGACFYGCLMSRCHSWCIIC